MLSLSTWLATGGSDDTLLQTTIYNMNILHKFGPMNHRTPSVMPGPFLLYASYRQNCFCCLTETRKTISLVVSQVSFFYSNLADGFLGLTILIISFCGLKLLNID